MNTGTKEYKTRLSSAGLVYRHYGQEIIRAYALKHKITSEKDIMLLYDRIYSGFIEHVDGIDNGVEMYSSENGGAVVRNYAITTSLSDRVGSLYPRWNAPNKSSQLVNDQFRAAVKLATGEFFDCVDYFVASWLPARAIVQESFSGSASIHPSRRILAFQEGGCPWKAHLYDIEKLEGADGRTAFVLFPDEKGGWRTMAVPQEQSQFTSRAVLPWKGLRNEELCKAAGIPGCTFVHAAGFIGGNVTFEGAQAMAVKALGL